MAINIPKATLQWSVDNLRTKAFLLRYEPFVISPLYKRLVCVMNLGIVCIDIESGAILWEISKPLHSTEAYPYDSMCQFYLTLIKISI